MLQAWISTMQKNFTEHSENSLSLILTYTEVLACTALHRAWHMHALPNINKSNNDRN